MSLWSGLVCTLTSGTVEAMLDEQLKLVTDNTLQQL